MHVGTFSVEKGRTEEYWKNNENEFKIQHYTDEIYH